MAVVVTISPSGLLYSGALPAGALEVQCFCYTSSAPHVPFDTNVFNTMAQVNPAVGTMTMTYAYGADSISWVFTVTPTGLSYTYSWNGAPPAAGILS